MIVKVDTLTSSRFGTIEFRGPRFAELFTQELAASLHGVLQKNRVHDPLDTISAQNPLGDTEASPGA